jgi:hypothetical protein
MIARRIWSRFELDFISSSREVGVQTKWQTMRNAWVPVR